MSYRVSPVPHTTLWSSSNQTIAAVNTAQAITFSSSASTAGITLVASTKVTLPAVGVYQFAISAVVQAAASNKSCSIWLRKNGSDVANSNTKVICLNGEPTILAVTINLDCTAVGDYYELYMAGTDTTVGVYATAATAGPPAQPAVPSIILTVTQVS